MKTTSQTRILAVGFVLFLAVPARAYYSPEQGRWISRDPIDEKGGPNLYEFVANRPLDSHDPTGLTSVGFEHATGLFEDIGKCLGEWFCNKRVGWETHRDCVAKLGADVGDKQKGGNAFLHCVVACRATKRCGAEAAKQFWDAYDGPGSKDRKRYGDADSDMDLRNNAVGYQISGDCWKGCIHAWESGNLHCLKEDTWPIKCPSAVPNGL